MRTPVLMVAALVLASCATTRHEWQKPNSAWTPFDRESDMAACRAQAAAGDAAIYTQITVARDCMVGKGWRLVPVTP
jgi:hypothetical protein